MSAQALCFVYLVVSALLVEVETRSKEARITIVRRIVLAD